MQLKDTIRKMSLIVGTIVLFGTLACTPSHAQVTIDVEVPPVCEYGYYDYAPYGCAPEGFWGPDYFYNGIFIGVGPWEHWGYRHGWGDHHFEGSLGHGGPSDSHFRGNKEVINKNKEVNNKEVINKEVTDKEVNNHNKEVNKQEKPDAGKVNRQRVHKAQKETPAHEEKK